MRKCTNLFLVIVGLCLIFGMANQAMADVSVTAHHELEAETQEARDEFNISLLFTLETSGTESLNNVILEINDSTLPALVGAAHILNIDSLVPGTEIEVNWHIESSQPIVDSMKAIYIEASGTDANGNSIFFTIVSEGVTNE